MLYKVDLVKWSLSTSDYILTYKNYRLLIQLATLTNEAPSGDGLLH